MYFLNMIQTEDILVVLRTLYCDLITSFTVNDGLALFFSLSI